MDYQLYKRVLSFVRPFIPKLILAIFFSIIVGAIATSPVPIIQKVFDDIFVQKDYFMLKAVPIGLALLYLLKAVLTYAQNLIIFGLSWDLISQVRSQMFNHIHHLPFGFFEKNQVGQLISRIMNDASVMQSTVTRLLKEVIQNGIMLIGLLGWLFYMKWDWALISMVIFPLVVVPVSNIARKLKRLSHRGQEILGHMNSVILESFSGVKIVRSFGLEPREIEKFDRFNNDYLTVMKKNVKYVEITSPLLEFLGILSATIILWYGGTEVIKGTVTQGTFIAFLVALFMLYGPIRLLFKIFASFQISLAGAERVFAILDMEEEKVQEGSLELSGLNDRIEYKNVSFRYPTRSTEVLKNINLSIRKSQVVAVVGMSGAGKTTLVDMLFRFFDVGSGEILIDGTNIKDFRINSLRGCLALVTQDTFLFNDTIWNNILFGEPNASPDQILAAAKAAHVDSFVQKLDEGYETMIGERGVKLSGGQKQRIAIARAILRDAPILVLDEATSSLDSESEKLVQEALHNLMEHRTNIVIAHRLSTIKHADNIVVMDQGQIVETGVHKDLLAHSGLYRKYYEVQFKGAENEI
ncbi:MAG: hypothetical protein COV66_14450 [Nitrospinae bacterium CG11_big_fil_rev_8_21_14_0_20_45_15]|nr:MAG: hypothetical protein COV66_14450 [Nitrospinae bacterium CG11_big_fil_rev_8_21_14_0_20_45_15]